MMHEVLSRRFVRTDSLPDLIVVDGGKGQLNVALAVLKELQINVDAIGLAKEDRHPLARKSLAKKVAAKSEDRVFIPKRKDPIFLSRWPHALALLQRVRDEAHRFAVSYHHKLKENEDLHSILDDIPYIGDERKTALLKYFETVSRVKEATIEELQEVEGIGKERAKKIYDYFEIEKDGE
jgi:excinuclease ABC subunit C